MVKISQVLSSHHAGIIILHAMEPTGAKSSFCCANEEYNRIRDVLAIHRFIRDFRLSGQPHTLTPVAQPGCPDSDDRRESSYSRNGKESLESRRLL
jgi:hypothetical protein